MKKNTKKIALAALISITTCSSIKAFNPLFLLGAAVTAGGSTYALKNIATALSPMPIDSLKLNREFLATFAGLVTMLYSSLGQS